MMRLVFLLVVIILYFILVVYNMEDKIVLKYALGLSTEPLPVYLLILASLVFGMILTGVMTLPGWIRLRMEMRRQRRKIEQMEQEINRLASTTLNPTQPTYTDEIEEV
jgi:uncharacterized membrane protein YciS (DUF1049 family)